jgi:hypothetical protein
MYSCMNTKVVYSISIPIIVILFDPDYKDNF